MNILGLWNKSSEFPFFLMGKFVFDIQMLWITSMFPEQIILTSQGFTTHDFRGSWKETVLLYPALARL